MWQIPRIMIHKIFAHAQRTMPQECVGVLFGRDGVVTGVRPLANTLQDPARFLADPAEQIALFRSLREAGDEVMAIYHSHPQGPARPSQADLEQSNFPDLLHLIVSLAEDGRMEVAGFQMRDGQATPQPLDITEG